MAGGGGRKVMCDKLKVTVESYITQRNSGDLVYPMCMHTRSWVHRLARGDLSDFFKPIRAWIDDGWAMNLESRICTRKRSIALF